ncbi:MAG TPA: lysophospholipid acyltransferase family protein [Myxococcota bacterium]|nr:lysophospholipid acyltransferase family protein [Myxococcota bacterium]
MARSAPDSSGSNDTLSRALEGLRRELRQRLEDAGAAASRSVTSDDLFELFNRLRKAANSFGMRDRSVEVDEFGLDPAAVERSRPLLDFLCERWWRVEVEGLEQLDPEEPALLVANHSGLLPYDGLVLAHVIERAIGRRPRFLVADWLVTLPFAQPRLARLGGVRACRENAQRLLRAGHSVIAFPEGAKGATKVFADRYRVQRFGRGGVVRVALEERVPLVPVSVVGAEEAHPILFKLRTMARSVGLPFVPVTPTFPWLGPAGLLPLPSKWRIRIGAPMPTDGVGAESADDEVLISRMTEDLRQRIQSMLDEDRRARAGVFS